MQLLERLQYHIRKLNEGGLFFWDEDDSGKDLEIVFDPTSVELQNFLKDYPVCKAVSNGYGDWVFAYGRDICHDDLDGMLRARSNDHLLSYNRSKPLVMDDHLSVTRDGKILGYREAGSFESALCIIFEEGDDPPFNKKQCYLSLKRILEAIKSLKRKYSWLKLSNSLIEELQALRNVRRMGYQGDTEWYKWYRW